LDRHLANIDYPPLQRVVLDGLWQPLVDRRRPVPFGEVRGPSHDELPSHPISWDQKELLQSRCSDAKVITLPVKAWDES